MVTAAVVAGLLIAAAGAALAMMGLALRYRTLPGAVGIAAGCASLAVWQLSAALEVLARDHVVKHIAYNMVFTAVCAFTLAVFGAMTGLAGRRVTRTQWALAAAPVPVTVVLLWTGLGNLMFRTVDIPRGRGPIDNVPGPWFLVHALWAYALILLGFALFIGVVLRAGPAHRVQGLLMVAIVIVPLAFNTLFIAQIIGFGGYDPTPLALLITLGGLALGVLRMGFLHAQLGVLPVARDAVVEAMRDGMVVVDGRGRVLDINPAAAALLGTHAEAARGAPATAVIPDWTDDRSVHQWEFTARPGGEERVVEASCTAIRPGHPRSPKLAMLRDVTERRHAQAALEVTARLSHHQARHDPLTGLPNRTLLFETLRATLGDAPAGECTALLILDLDGFKDLNDTFGHRAGDDALCELAARMTRAAGAGATVARLAGDEFAVLLPRHAAAAAEAVAGRIQDALRIPFSVEGTEVRLAGSIGIALAPRHGVDPDEIVHAADVAMYRAKRHTAGVAVYASHADQRRPERLIMRHQLREGITDGTLEVHYQPQLGAHGEIVGAEALVRWRHPERGLLAPNQFLGLAEGTELVCQLTDAVLAEALGNAMRWDARRLGLRVAVNMSECDLRDPSLAERIERALHRAGATADVLTLEVTENALATVPNADSRLDDLRERGVRVSLDDFGTGFAPISTLRGMPVDELKIDRSFVRDMAESERDFSLVRGLIRLGHDLGLRVVAEGVETREVADGLHALDCDVLQGFLIGRPAPAGSAQLVAAGL